MWKRYRRIAGLAQAALIIGLPFLKVRGESALRFDLASLKLYFFGTVIWINEFYLILLAVLFLLLFILTVTNVLGRVWCGWLCPQTVLLDLARDLSRIFYADRSSAVQRLLLLPLSAAVSMTLIWYFVPPVEAVRGLFTSKLILGFFLSLWVIIFAELALLGRIFCKTVCPYSMLQSGLFDRSTLVIAFDSERSGECMGCDKCARVCPVGIDIKDGLRRECIACAECIDACSSMVKGRGIPSLIGFRGKVLRQKSAALTAVTALSATLLVFAVAARPEIDFVITRNPEQPLKGINSYTYTVRNNKDSFLTGNFSVKGAFFLIGEGRVEVKPHDMVHGRVIVKAMSESVPGGIVFVLQTDGHSLERRVGFL